MLGSARRDRSDHFIGVGIVDIEGIAGGDFFAADAHGLFDDRPGLIHLVHVRSLSYSAAWARPET